MAAVLNRTTKAYFPSANTPDYPVAQWIHNPNLTAVAGYPSKYWIITGDVVTLMTQAQRDAVDAAELGAVRDDTADRMNNPEDIIRAYAIVNLEDRNDYLVTTINSILTAIDSATTLADLKTRVAAIADIPLRSGAQYRDQVRAKLGV